MKSLLNMNVFGGSLVLIAFAVSLAQVLHVSMTAGDAAGHNPVIRIAHWQLEPGYRQAVDEAIAEYMALPHVKEANVEVRQSPVTEKIYDQWLNVQLISGTAPDICEKGKAKMTQGGAYTAKFFVPLGDIVNEPNPYNAPHLLPDDIDPSLAKLLAAAPWRETLLDGMRGGWDESLQNYYAVPTSSFGALRLYYNKRLIAQAKQLIHAGLTTSSRPAWLAARINDGFVPDDDDLRSWASNDSPPDTLGRLFVTCSAVRAVADQAGNDKLVPIAGSSYSQNMFVWRYAVPFTAVFAERLDHDLNSDVSGLETYAGWQTGVWRFDEPRIKAFYECINEYCRQFPPGFLALERDQANNRFVLGRAAMIASGAWDAGSLFHGAASRADEKDRFEVGVMDFPLPAPGEKWYEHIGDRANEAQTAAGAPYAVSQRSPHREWAVDFLKFLTSYRVNQKFNRNAGWIPVVIGSTPTRDMQPFAPNPVGVFAGAGLKMSVGGSNIRTVYEGQLWLYMSGDITYDTFVSEVTKAIEESRSGVMRLWFYEWEKARTSHRNQERMLAVQAARHLLLDADDAEEKYRRAVSESVRANNGDEVRAFWRELFGDKPFPEF